VRYREDTPAEQERARAAVEQWRGAHPDGSPEEMLAEIGPGFDKDYGPVLRAALFRADTDAAHVRAGTTDVTGQGR